ncbi:putative electron transfer flavoprotein, alpha subunit [Candidatus Zinderia insecticola CARI]|uniref:Electron transfer flavoprotein subunit alpha n=1 Tax=Zinderia insecticola (strain CARI) TaxID=871271 RepID=E0TIR6_ZINIC|nr:putative electron transfer flavoprotein, alpha subunit [Candidatus Zinderia insecticola CARI]
MNILICIEYKELKINNIIYNLIESAKKIKNDKNENNIYILIIGYKIKKNFIKSKLDNIVNIKKVIIFNNIIFKNIISENVVNLLLNLYKKYNYLIFPSNHFGKNILPRLASKIDVSPISDVINILNKNTFEKLIHSGNIKLTVKSYDPIKLLTIRFTNFSNINIIKNTKYKVKFKYINNNFDKFKKTKFINIKEIEKNNLNLNNSKIIIGGGRGLKSIKGFEILKILAKKLNAAIGATRSAVDAGYISNNFQIGQSGKIIAPDIYMAIGISGAIQHIAGIKDSKTIISINQDEEAPIFSISDYGIIGDLFILLPKLIKMIK